jgi:hypothetical protein
MGAYFGLSSSSGDQICTIGQNLPILAMTGFFVVGSVPNNLSPLALSAVLPVFATSV